MSGNAPGARRPGALLSGQAAKAGLRALILKT